MKDLTEAQLIEMERRARYLICDLEEDPTELGRNGLEDEWETAREKLAQVAQDVETLCEHVRAQVPK